jgi:hypothetical protein
MSDCPGPIGTPHDDRSPQGGSRGLRAKESKHNNLHLTRLRRLGIWGEKLEPSGDKHEINYCIAFNYYS